MLNNLLGYGFEKAGEIFLNKKNMVDFKIDNSVYKSQDYAQVYAWVLNVEIMYIGKATKGVQKRLSEHRGGWRGGSKTGISKEKLIRQKLEAGLQIEIYGRSCEYFFQNVDIFGETKEIRYDLAQEEEDFLIKKFRPTWNSNGLK
jgi:hypothetical protein